MNTEARLELPTVDLTLPFVRLDAGDVTELRELDVLIDLPNVLSLVRFHFRSGTGFEMISSGMCDGEDYNAAVTAMEGAKLIAVNSHGVNGFGEPMNRSWYWADTGTPDHIRVMRQQLRPY
ncbi:hypothetical protein O7635_29370 [Asanoa sp. WMMD1127]|uniref:hypothetical protein n=1 Tax=Asanoa sp. WMMD1127 TaxID=3016107 RepID=UPI0024169E30|nr:hypothetical protein [Asanoa sp. WMMD1127]MDG4825979.1 hypothetical protein [Asanoa sp. WMMD1127]